MFLSDEGPTLETLDFTIRISSTPTFLYFDLFWHSIGVLFSLAVKSKVITSSHILYLVKGIFVSRELIIVSWNVIYITAVSRDCP